MRDIAVFLDCSSGGAIKLEREDAIVKRMRMAVVGSALAMLSGCVVLPLDAGYPGYYSGDPAAQAYPGGAPAYYGPSYYYGPAVGVGVYGRYRYRHRYWYR